MGAKRDKVKGLAQGLSAAKTKELSAEGLEGALARLRHAEKHSYDVWTASGSVSDLKSWHGALDLLRKAEDNLLVVLTKRRDLLPAGEVQTWIGRKIDAAKAALLDMPARISPGLESLPWPEIQKILEREVRGALRGISDPIK
jgi:hypothetical protein